MMIMMNLLFDAAIIVDINMRMRMLCTSSEFTRKMIEASDFMLRFDCVITHR